MGEDLVVVYDEAMTVTPNACGDPTASIDSERLIDFGGGSVRRRFGRSHYLAVDDQLKDGHGNKRLRAGLHFHGTRAGEADFVPGFLSVNFQKEYRAVGDECPAGLVGGYPVVIRQRIAGLYIDLAAARDGMAKHVHAGVRAGRGCALQAAVQDAVIHPAGPLYIAISQHVQGVDHSKRHIGRELAGQVRADGNLGLIGGVRVAYHSALVLGGARDGVVGRIVLPMIGARLSAEERLDEPGDPKQWHVAVHRRDVAEFLLDHQQRVLRRERVGLAVPEILGVEDARGIGARDQEIGDANVLGLSVQPAVFECHVDATLDVVGVHVDVARVPAERGQVGPAFQPQGNHCSLVWTQEYLLLHRHILEALYGFEGRAACRHIKLEPSRGMEEGFVGAADLAGQTSGRPVWLAGGVMQVDPSCGGRAVFIDQTDPQPARVGGSSGEKCQDERPHAVRKIFRRYIQ